MENWNIALGLDQTGNRAMSIQHLKPRPGGLWYFAVVTISLAILVLGFFIAKRHLFPNYWSVEDLGPVGINSREAPGALEGMVWIPGGVFWMGSDEFPHAKPVHKVYVDGFWMDKTEVTNEQFAKFVEATGYVTLVERWPDVKNFKGFNV